MGLPDRDLGCLDHLGGSFFANLDGGDIDLPWASLAGFGDVFALMVLGVWLAARHVRRSSGPLHRTTEGKVS